MFGFFLAEKLIHRFFYSIIAKFYSSSVFIILYIDQKLLIINPKSISKYGGLRTNLKAVGNLGYHTRYYWMQNIV